MRASLLLVLSLATVLVSSGCTIPSGTTGNGVVVEEFSLGGLTEYYPGEPVTIFLKARNQGSVSATNVFGEVLGLDEDWAAASSSIPDNPIHSGEILPQEVQCRHTTASGNHYTLLPPNPAYSTPGEVATCTWRYKTPQVPEGLNPSYQLTARLFYDYSTDVVESFTILPTDELIRYNQQGRTVPASTLSSTRSPVSVTTKAREPIRFWDSGTVSFPLAITLSNSGGGMVCLPGRCKKASSGGHVWNKVNLKIEPISSGLTLSDECRKFSSGSEVEVWPNRDNTITCDIQVSGTGDILGYEERLLRVSAEYSYFVDSQSTIRIL